MRSFQISEFLSSPVAGDNIFFLLSVNRKYAGIYKKNLFPEKARFFSINTDRGKPAGGFLYLYFFWLCSKDAGGLTIAVERLFLFAPVWSSFFIYEIL